MDKVLIERMRCSLKREAVNLRELADRFKAPAIIADRIVFYLSVRPHSASDNVISFWVADR